MSKKTRVVQDSMGEMEIPEDALFRAQTQRALNNFQISDLHLPDSLIRAIALIKKACAQSLQQNGMMVPDVSSAIQSAANQIIQGKHRDQFLIDVFQTGSGTSTNMNVNEVIASLASEEGCDIHPNDHVNMGQSSNDVFPSAIHVAASIQIHEFLLPELNHLEQQLNECASEYHDVAKTGRTHLMDAMPITLGQEIQAWAAMIKNDRYRIQTALTRLQQLAIGGTAVGTGVNAPSDFGDQVCEQLKRETGIRFAPMENRFEAISSQNASLEMSGQIRTLSASIGKICNDLRWMNSGPLTGLNEVHLKALQPGSSIMPSKVNPVIPEAILMVVAQIHGNDQTIHWGAQSGNFQLNTMLPVIAYNLLQNIQLMTNACHSLRPVLKQFEVNREQLSQAVDRNPILATALNPVIGYQQAAEIARRATAENRSVLDVAIESTSLTESELRKILDPERLAFNTPLDEI